MIDSEKELYQKIHEKALKFSIESTKAWLNSLPKPIKWFKLKMTDAEKLEICKRLYAAEHCQFTDCANKDCFECILEKYEEINDDEIEIID